MIYNTLHRKLKIEQYEPTKNRGTRAPVYVWYNNNLNYLKIMSTDEISQIQKMASEEVKWWRGLYFVAIIINTDTWFP